MTKNKKSLRCDICEADIDSCDSCSTWFEKGDAVFCGNQLGQQHICSDCCFEEGTVI